MKIGKIFHLFLIGWFIIPMSVGAQTPIDSLGIYAMRGGKAEKMEVNIYENVRTGNFFASAFTMGLVEMKAKYEYAGRTSKYHFEHQVVMRMFFRHVPNAETLEELMFDTCYTVRDFHVTRMEQKKKKRLLTGLKATIVKARKGVKLVDDMIINYRKVREGVYDVYINGAPGEYALVFTGINAYHGAFIYDFTIE